MLIATHSGLRGRPGVELTDDVVDRAVGSLVAMLRAAGLPERVAVARDDRATSAPMAELVVEGLLARGADAIELGAISTPGAKVAARRSGAGGAVVVTGSHLAEELNGLKFVAAPAWGPLDFRRLPAPAPVAATRGRRRAESAASETHAQAIGRAVDIHAIAAARLSVGVDGGVGDGAQRILESLGCVVANGSADLTLHLDADADRVRLGDESGTQLDSETTLVMAVSARHPALVVRSSDTSRAVDDLQRARGARLEVVAPGELHLVRGLAGERDAIAGEGNGGVIVPAAGPGRDGLAAGALAIERVARTGTPLAELVSLLPSYARVRSSVTCEEEGDAARRLAAVAKRLGLPAPSDPELGVTIDRGPAWGLVRRSATEPVLRVTAEAGDRAAAAALHAELESALGS